jgi:hypothetical protein
VPLLVQPLIVALAGAIPFVDGEVASVIGVLAGLHPVAAGIAAGIGNFACVAVIVVVGVRIRDRVRTRRATARVAGAQDVAAPAATAAPTTPAREESKGRRRFRRMLVRFGAPGACILGPIAIPAQFTSVMLIGTGVRRGWILLWQGVSIALWTTLTTLVATGALALAEA